MGWSKRQFVEKAYEEIGLASYVFDLTPEQLSSAVYRLDAMIASWNALGIRLGYPIPSSPQDADLDEATNVPDSANEAIFTNLGVRLAPMFGKQVSPDAKQTARAAYNALMVKNAEIPQMRMPRIPAGAGNKTIWRTFITPEAEGLTAGNDGYLLYDGNEQLNGEEFS